MSESKENNRGREPDGAAGPEGRVCPRCGAVYAGGHEGMACPECGLVDSPIDRQRVHNEMGPWAVRIGGGGGRSLVSFDRLTGLIDAGTVGASTPVRGPTTRQFWRRASEVPGVAVYLGRCHACGALVDRIEDECPSCAAALHPPHDRQMLGLPSPNLLPGSADAASIARAALGSGASSPLPSASRASRPPSPPVSAVPGSVGIEGLPSAPALPGERPDRPSAPADSDRAAETGRLRLAAAVFGAATAVLMVVCLSLGALLILNLGASRPPTDATPPAAEREGAPDDAATDRVAQDGRNDAPPTPSGATAGPDAAGVEGGSEEPGVVEPADRRLADSGPGVGEGDEGEAGASTADRSPSVDAEGGHAARGGERWPLDAAAEPYRDRIESALALSRGDDPSSLRSAIETLAEIRGEITAGSRAPDRAASLPLLEHYLAERRSRLALIEIRTLIGSGGG